MKDILIVLSMCLAAIILGAWLFFYGPGAFSQSKAEQQQAAPLTAEAPVTQNAVSEVSFRILDSGAQAVEVTERKNFAVYDAQEFARLWKMAHGTDGVAVPNIDFSKEYAIGVFAGTKSSGGHLIAVEKITEAGDTRTVGMVLTKPGANCVVTEALTSPYQIIVVPFSSAFLAPRETTVETPC